MTASVTVEITGTLTLTQMATMDMEEIGTTTVSTADMEETITTTDIMMTGIMVDMEDTDADMVATAGMEDMEGAMTGTTTYMEGITRQWKTKFWSH